MTFKEILNCYCVEYTKNLIDEKQITDIEKAMNVSLGSHLKSYILEYGYMGYEYVELYGVYSNLFLKSDMITQTQYLHKYFEKTIPYVALENPGEGDYILVDTNDNVYEYQSETDHLIDLKKDVIQYIYDRFAEAE